MSTRRTRGFALVGYIVGFAVAGMMVVITTMGSHLSSLQSADMRCKGNLKEFEVALQLYKNDWDQKYPGYSGVKFVAILYRTGYLTNKKYFLCPARKDAAWNEGADVAKRTDAKFQKPAPGDKYEWPWEPRDLFRPCEITYAGRRNDIEDNNGRFRLTGEAGDPTPIVSDSTLDHKGNNEAKNGPHDGGVNVLLTDGSIVRLKDVAVGVRYQDKKMDLECLMNDNNTP